MAFTPGPGPVGAGLPMLPEQPQPSNPLLALLQRLQVQRVAQAAPQPGIHWFGPGGSGVFPEPHPGGPIGIPGQPVEGNAPQFEPHPHADPLAQLREAIGLNPHNPAEQIHHMLPPGPHSDFLHLLQHPAVQRLLGRRIESRSSMAAHADRKAMAAHHANDPRLGY